MSALITATELKEIIAQPHVKVLDASYNLPPSAMGIAGAIDFDIDDVADPAAPLPHTVPSAEVFAAKVGAMGIGNNDLVVIYDRKGLAMAAARAWWLFRLFGHDNVKVLDGGLPAWLSAGYAAGEKAAHPPAPVTFVPHFRPELVKMMDDINTNLTNKSFAVLDARDAARFRGDAPDPRPNVATGHIPQALNTPFSDLLQPDGRLKPKDALLKTFQNAQVNPQSKLACSCGSGVTACVVALALYELGAKDVAVYDGSWAEWGTNPAVPKAKGV